MSSHMHSQSVVFKNPNMVLKWFLYLFIYFMHMHTRAHTVNGVKKFKGPCQYVCVYICVVVRGKFAGISFLLHHEPVR